VINRVDFWYRDDKGETAFETFLKYTNEKEKSSAVLGIILQQSLGKGKVSFLDVGAGNGEYLRLALKRVKQLGRVIFTLLEPSDDLIKRLKLTVEEFFSESTVEIVHSTFEDFTAAWQFDVILVSHVPLAKDRLDKLPEIFAKMLGLLKPNGQLIVVLRKKDDIHDLRTRFKSKLMGRDYTSITIDDAAEILNKLAENMSLRISMFSAESELRLPITNNMQDVISIIEFFLNTKWEEFPSDIQKEVLDYIGQKNGTLHQIDGFAVVQKGESLLSIVP
jgi:SAM-dependent methyltransferase